VTYDIVQQVLNGRIDQGYNRRLVRELFQDAKIAEKILHTQALNTQMRSVTVSAMITAQRLLMQLYTVVKANVHGGWA